MSPRPGRAAFNRLSMSGSRLLAGLVQEIGFPQLWTKCGRPVWLIWVTFFAFFQQSASLPVARQRRRRVGSAPAPCVSAGWRATLRRAGACARRRPFSLDLPCRSWVRPRRRIADCASGIVNIVAPPCHESPLASGFHSCGNQYMLPKTAQRFWDSDMRRFKVFLALRLPVRYGRSAAIAGCGSSVVEHSLGKGEVESSILSRSTSLFRSSIKNIGFSVASVNADCYGIVLWDGWKSVANARFIQAQGLWGLARQVPNPSASLGPSRGFGASGGPGRWQKPRVH